MKASVLAFVLGAFAAGAVACSSARTAPPPAPAAGPIYSNAAYKFTCVPPAFPKAEANASQTVASFLAPPHDGFSSNVGIIVQSVKMTLDEYVDLSKKQFKQMELNAVSENKVKVSGRDAVVWEYEGVQSKRKFKWLAMAVIDGDRVFLLTGTALASDYEQVAKEFKACLDSFKIED